VPRLRRRINNVALRRDDRVILIASHNLDELARLADRVGILDHGVLRRGVTVRGGASREGAAAPYRIAVAHGAELMPEVFPGARDAGQGEFELESLTLEEINAGIATLIARGALVSLVVPVHSLLEQQFREAVSASEDLS